MKPFAIYFPQFYPTPTNNQAWGYGFSDWVLVASANLKDSWPRRAPRRGYYDGSDAAVNAAQLEEMSRHGLGGLALYHYWFYSHQELPAFEQHLLRGRLGSTMPWFLIWANEGWSRRWLGDPSPLVTLSDRPTEAAVREHCRHLAACFSRRDYLRINGKPLFIFYHLNHFADPATTVEMYRHFLRALETEVVLGHFIKNPADADSAEHVDISYLFEPRLFFGHQKSGRGARTRAAFEASRRIVGDALAQQLLVLADRFQQRGTPFSSDIFLKYLCSDARRALIKQLPTAVQEVVSPGWNNTPRYGARFTALADVEPSQFGQLLKAAAEREPSLPPLINAWNEWSEGAAVEPCFYQGTRYLDSLSVEAGYQSMPTETIK